MYLRGIACAVFHGHFLALICIVVCHFFVLGHDVHCVSFCIACPAISVVYVLPTLTTRVLTPVISVLPVLSASLGLFLYVFVSRRKPVYYMYYLIRHL